MLKQPTNKNYNWKTYADIITYSNNDQILFQDTHDHWNNAICRLLKLSDKDARKWIEFCFNDSKNFTINNLIKASNQFFNCKTTYYSKDLDLVIYANQVENDLKFCVAGKVNSNHAQLIDVRTKSLASPPEYSEDYFEHGTNSRKGYGNLLAQTDWRIEKAYRYFNLVMETINKPEVKLNKKLRVLDVGSGYGHMRIPFEENKHSTSGIEISKYAAEIAKKEYNLDTTVGDLSTLKQSNDFNIVLCYDIIEHVKYPELFINEAKNQLADEGFIVIRTPNLKSLEAQVFGNKFHSFKLEHLNYFSVDSLSMILMSKGFEIVSIRTFSHLFDGFIKIDSSSIEKSHLGSDIFCIAKKIIND